MDHLKYRALVERHSREILEAERHIWRHPESGFREWETSRYLEGIFEGAGYALTRPGDIPGFYADLDTGRPGPKILILCELDALVAPRHFEAADNGRAHACGHHAQCAAMVGIALALKEAGALDGLCGSIRLMAVPAEEGIEIGYRAQLRRQGVIRYLTGKAEFLHRGYMDGVDLAYMFHTGVLERHKFVCSAGSNGLIVKTARYEGVAAHAGGCPDRGVNALYAASLGLSAVNALRETFRDQEHIRVHPIVTSGGDSINIIPSLAQVETFVRGASIQSIADASRKVNRALAAGALALGARLRVTDYFGYAPLHNAPALVEVARECMSALVGEDAVCCDSSWGCGSTDMGDLSGIMPCIHPHIAGAAGASHGDDYHIADAQTACVLSAQGQLLLAVELLRDDARRAREVIASFTPLYPDKEAYFRDIDRFFADWSAVDYDGDEARVQF